MKSREEQRREVADALMNEVIRDAAGRGRWTETAGEAPENKDMNERIRRGARREHVEADASGSEGSDEG